MNQTSLKTTLKEKLKILLVEELYMDDFSPEDIGDDDNLFGEKFGLDSIDAVEIVFFVEKKFGISITNMKEARPALQSVETLAEFIQDRTGL